MKQFLYLDTDIVNSIIAQSEKGIITGFSTEEENGEQKSTNKSISGNLEGDAGGKLLKVFNAELKLDIRGGIGTEKEVHSASREIITKTYILRQERKIHMAEYNWNDIIARLNKMIRYGTAPVGMKWVKTEEEFKSIPKVRVHEKHYPPCVVLGQAHQFGWTTACKFENVHANYCRGINGLFERDEKWYSGEMFNKVWFKELESSKAHNLALECIPSGYYALVCSPVDAGKINDPDVCVLYTSSAQAFMLYAGWQYMGYEKLHFTFVGESTCADSWCHTFLTGKPGLGIPSFADRKFGAAGEWELRVTFKPDDLVRAIEGMEAMWKAGLRYPMASHSLTTDVCPGMPPHYLEF